MDLITVLMRFTLYHQPSSPRTFGGKRYRTTLEPLHARTASLHHILLCVVITLLTPQYLCADITTGLSLWWRLNEAQGTAIKDSSGNHFDTSASQASWTLVPRVGLTFPASGTPFTTQSALSAAGAATLAFWARFDPSNLQTPSYPRYLVRATNPVAGHSSWSIYINNGALRFNLDSQVEYSCSVPTDGQWHHFALRNSSGAAAVYVDGALSTSGAGRASQDIQTISLGHAPNISVVDFVGDLSDFRFYNRALDASDITQLYTQPIPPDINSSLTAYWPFDQGTATDATGHGFDGTFQNVTVVADPVGNSNSAVQFNGNSSSMGVSNTIAMQNQQTVTFWVKPSVVGNHPILEKGVAGYGGEVDWYIGLRSDNTVYWAVNTDNGSTGIFAQALGQTPLPVGQWSCVACVIDKANGTIRLYVNSALDASASMGGRDVRNQNRPVRIGKSVTNQNTDYFNGAIDDVRIYARTLNTTELAAINQFNTNFEVIWTENFDGALLNPNVWTVRSGDNVSVANGTARISSGTNWSGLLNSFGKKSIQNNDFIVEFRARRQGSYDLSLALTDGANTITCMESNYSSNNGLTLTTSGDFGSSGQSNGQSTESWKEYRLTCKDKQVILQRGDTLASISESLSSALNTNFGSHALYFTMSNGGGDTAEFDWIKIYYPNVNSSQGVFSIYGDGRHGSYIMTTSMTIEQLYQAVRLPGDPANYDPSNPNAMPQFKNLTISNNAVLSANAWDGSQSGKIALKVQGLLFVAQNSAISANALGYGAGAGSGAGGNGQAYYNNGYGYWDYRGGGGAGFGTAGANGGNGADYNYAPGGAGGIVYGTPTLTSSYLGSGGGTSGGGDAGGRGGGNLTLNAGRIRVSGSLSANGGNGASANAGGGGGSGGAIKIYAIFAELGTNLINANGGAAGGAGTSRGYGGAGGGGGGGRIRVDISTSASFATSPSASSGVDPTTDQDNDGIQDSVEWGTSTDTPRDTDSDSIPDYLDTDSNNNGIPDSIELGADSQARTTDTDGDGIPDYWETFYGINPNSSSDANNIPPGDSLPYFLKFKFSLKPNLTDNDNDGISDYDEIILYGTNPLNTDTDGDGIPDRWEISHGLNPRYNDANDDADLDGLSNLQEYAAGTDPKNRYSNGATVDDLARIKNSRRVYAAYDGNNRLAGVSYSNGYALVYQYDGNSNLVHQQSVSADADQDGLPDPWEIVFGLSSSSGVGNDGPWGDPDQDSYTNYQEWLEGTHPRNAASHADPIKTPSALFRETPTLARIIPGATLSGALPSLNLNLWDSEGNAAKVKLQYYETTTSTWKDGTLARLDGAAYNAKTAVNAYPSGSAHNVIWNAYQDLGGSFTGNMLLRVRGDDGLTTGAWSEPSSVALNMSATNNALLSSLNLEGVTLSPAFAPGTTSYAGTVSAATTNTNITATAVNPSAVITGIGSKSLNQTNTTVAVTVTAQDGITQQSYTVAVRRRSNDASLAALSLSGVTLSPPFNSGTTNYLATVHTTTSSTMVSATATDAAAVVTGTGFKALAPGGNAIALTVTAEDGNTQTYTVNVTQAAAMNGDLDLTLAPTADGSVNALALQPDGKLIAGGAFNTFGGQPRSHLARLNADGSLDTSFNPSLDGTVVHAVAMQADGKVLVGGDFVTCAGQTRNRMARLNADGSLDATFNPNADGEVFALLLQADGKILVGGAFANIGGLARSKIARLNTDGTADAAFNPGANDVAWALAVQADGKILVGGKFTQLGGTPRSRLGRLNADGTVDGAFNPGANSDVNAITVQADGKLLVGGAFNTLAGTVRSSLGRLNADGTLDTAFNPSANAVVDAFALTADGKILLVGDFTALGSISRVRLARLNADGTVDGSFNQDADARVSALALQTDGSVWIGGSFNNVSGTARAKIARLTNGPATQTVTSNATGRTLLWSRSGSSADVGRATFEKSLDGTTWTLLGSGSRVGSSSAWSLTGLALPVSQPFSIRARGQAMQAGGSSGGGQSLYEDSANITLTPVPEITLEQPVGTGLVDGAASVDFGANPAATQVERSFTLRNTGTADLSGITASITTGGGDFSITAAPASTLAAGGSTRLKVSLTTSASAAGTRAGHLSIASNDTERNPFDVELTGLTQAPQMVVEQPAGTSLGDGSSSVAFGNTLTGGSVSKTFTIKNTGNADLTGLGITLDGTNASDFSVTSTPTAPVTGPSGSTTFTLRFIPTTAGAKTAALHIANNDTTTTGSFDIALTGRAFIATADDDGDGISNATELNLAAFGFDPLSNNSPLLTQLRNNGLYQASDMQSLALGSPVLTRDSSTGHFHLNVNLHRSLNLTTWTPLSGFTPTFTVPTGTIDIDIPPDGTNAQFFRVMGNKP